MVRIKLVPATRAFHPSVLRTIVPTLGSPYSLTFPSGSYMNFSFTLNFISISTVDPSP